jgi:hypothetical protein
LTHYLNTKSTAKQNAEIVALDIGIVDRHNKNIPNPKIFKKLLYICSKPRDLPLYSPKRKLTDYAIPTLDNTSYYRDCYKYIHEYCNALSIKLRVSNTGSVSAKNIVVKIKFDPADSVDIKSGRMMPRVPSKIIDTFDQIINNKNYEPDVYVDGKVIEFDLDIINPGDSVTSSTIMWLRINNTGAVTATARIFAENLAEPIERIFRIEAKIEEVEITGNDIVDERLPKVLSEFDEIS